MKGQNKWAPLPHKKGSENGSSKLNEEKVLEIKNLINSGRSSYSIAKEYNVSKTTILRIKNSINWKHVGETCLNRSQS